MDMHLSKLWGDNEGQGNLACTAVQSTIRVGHDLATEYQQQVSSYIFKAGNAASLCCLLLPHLRTLIILGLSNNPK